jgi:hypothetical protein
MNTPPEDSTQPGEPAGSHDAGAPGSDEEASEKMLNEFVAALLRTAVRAEQGCPPEEPTIEEKERAAAITKEVMQIIRGETEQDNSGGQPGGK